MGDTRLGPVESRFADLIWANEPLASSQLVQLAQQELQWKKSTTYTVLKRLCSRGLFQNQSGTVSSLLSREEFYARQSEQFVEETFDGSLPAFLAAFTTRKKLSDEEVRQLQQLIEENRKGGGFMSDFLAYELLPRIWNMSIAASVVIVFVLAARLLLKKAPKVFSYALWSVVLFRLLCPFSIPTGFSLLALTDAPIRQTAAHTTQVQYVQPDLVHTEFPQVDLPVPGVSQAVNQALPQGEEQLVADPLEAPVALLTLGWMAGMALMAVYSVLSMLRLRRRLVEAVPLRDNIYLADHIASPFVLGVLRPKIYLPSTLSAEEQKYIILHEQYHIKRLDHLVKLLAFLALCIHWFNPLVWLSFFLAQKDMEMSCDEAVLQTLGAHIRADYSASLLSLSTGRRVVGGTPLAFGEGNAKGRIQNLLTWNKPRKWVVALAALVCVAVVASCGTSPRERSTIPSPPKTDRERKRFLR